MSEAVWLNLESLLQCIWIKQNITSGVFMRENRVIKWLKISWRDMNEPPGRLHTVIGAPLVKWMDWHRENGPHWSGTASSIMVLWNVRWPFVKYTAKQISLAHAEDKFLYGTIKYTLTCQTFRRPQLFLLSSVHDNCRFRDAWIWAFPNDNFDNQSDSLEV